MMSVFQRRKGIIFFGIILGTVVGTVLVLRLPEKWESSAQIHIIRHDPNLATEGSETSTINDFRRMEDELANQMKIMTSYRIVHDGLEEAKLLDLKSLRDECEEDETVVDYVIDNLYLSTQGEQGNVSVNGGHWIYATFVHTNKEDTPKVLEAVLAKYQKHISEIYSDRTTQAAEVITKFTTGVKEELEEQEKSYRDFMQSSPIYTSDTDSVNVYLNSWNDYETQLRLLQFERYASESRLEIIKNSMKPENRDKYTDFQRLALVDANHVERLGLLLSVENLEVTIATNSVTTEPFQVDQILRAETANTEFDTMLAARLELKQKRSEYGANHPKVKKAEENLQDLELFLANKKEDVPPPSNDTIEAIQPAVLIDAYISLLEKDLEDLQHREEILVGYRDAAEEKARSCYFQAEW
ncbi:MAG: hypothetical protein R3C11_21170 [Planctomycetaceae bacterium]